MTSLAAEHYATPSSRRQARWLAYAEEWALDDLSGRTLWSASGPARSHRFAHAMREQLPDAAEQGVRQRELTVTGDEPLALRLNAMLYGHGRAPGRLDPGDHELCAAAIANGDLVVGESVRADDLVVLHDPIAVVLAEAVRERGAHAVAYLQVLPHVGGHELSGLPFLTQYGHPVHAWVLARRRRVAALIPSVDVLAVSDRDDDPTSEPSRIGRLAWMSTLAEVLRADRAETVGGTVHVRPVVAWR